MKTPEECHEEQKRLRQEFYEREKTPERRAANERRHELGEAVRRRLL